MLFGLFFGIDCFSRSFLNLPACTAGFQDRLSVGCNDRPKTLLGLYEIFQEVGVPNQFSSNWLALDFIWRYMIFDTFGCYAQFMNLSAERSF